MPDITSLMMADHEWFRRQFAKLDDARSREELKAAWLPLATRLEIHAKAEETVFYPQLLEHGSSKAEDETKDAVRDHNKIRAAIADAEKQEVGSEEWHQAVTRARTENSEHLTEEEDEGFPNFRHHASHELREQLGHEWMRFYATHPDAQDVSSAPINANEFVKNAKTP